MPLYYRVAAQLLTQAVRIQVLGDDTSGEVEPVLMGASDRLWVTVGADHTDRKVESYGVADLQAGLPQDRSAARPGASRKSSRIGTGSMLRSFVDRSRQEGALPGRARWPGFARRAS